MAEARTTVMKIAITTGNEHPVFGETAIHVEIDDEAAGPYIVLRTPIPRDGGGVGITTEEWPAVQKAVERLLVECTAIELREAKEPSDA